MTLLLLPGTRANRPPDSAALADLCRLTLTRHPDAVVSHETAALLWQLPLPRTVPTLLHLTEPYRHRDASLGVVVHRAGLLNDERSWVHGVPVTSPIRTLTDLASTLEPAELAAVIADAVARPHPLTSAGELRARTAEHRDGTANLAALNEALASRAANADPTPRTQTYAQVSRLRLLGRVSAWSRYVSWGWRSTPARSRSSC
jgi:hypothetical protein